jgi:hypothetical protein
VTKIEHRIVDTRREIMFPTPNPEWSSKRPRLNDEKGTGACCGGSRQRGEHLGCIGDDMKNLVVVDGVFPLGRSKHLPGGAVMLTNANFKFTYPDGRT